MRICQNNLFVNREAYMTQISVIVLTYNPNEIKLRQTLAAVAAQKDISLEIIIGDDGSAQKDFSFLPDFMKELKVENYLLVDNQENRGTVQNCFDAIKVATGRYVFLTSPGDFLFDSYVLRDFYQFAEKNNAKLCFGNAVFYAKGEGKPKLTRKVGRPEIPMVYSPGKSLKAINTAFFGGSWIIGASYFRERELALETLKQIADTAKYVEDTTSTAAALAEGYRICYYDRNVIWYEDGTGVSTGGNDKWNRILRQDLKKSFEKLKKQYPKNPYLDFACRNLQENNRVRRILGNLICHPIVMVGKLCLQKAAKKTIRCSVEDVERLTQILNTK